MKIMWVGLLILATLSGCIGAGQNSPISNYGEGVFPTVSGIDLEGNEHTLPRAFAGRLNIVAIAFEREHQEAVNGWIEVAESIMSEYPDVRFYEVPLIYELNIASRFWVNNGMRSGIDDPVSRERTITVYTDRERFTELLDMRTDRIYLLLLDDNGSILWRTEGVAKDPTISELQAALQQFH